MKLYRENSLALISIIVTLLLALISDFALKLSDDTTYLTIVIGATVSLSVSLLEKNLKDAIQFYNHVIRIGDEGLRLKVIELIESLSRGEIPPEITTLRSVDRLKSTRKILFASDYDRKNTLQGIYDWSDNINKRNWHNAIKDLIEAGVNVERVYILKRSEVLKSGHFDARALHILQNHEQDGVSVRIIWVEDLDQRRPLRDILQSFAVYDNEEVVVATQFDRRWMYIPPSDKVHLYQEIFNEQRKYSYRLQDILS